MYKTVLMHINDEGRVGRLSAGATLRWSPTVRLALSDRVQLGRCTGRW